jgi:hypothetical protein
VFIVGGGEVGGTIGLVEGAVIGKVLGFGGEGLGGSSG